jgi:hypothetical protein
MRPQLASAILLILFISSFAIAEVEPHSCESTFFRAPFFQVHNSGDKEYKMDTVNGEVRGVVSNKSVITRLGTFSYPYRVLMLEIKDKIDEETYLFLFGGTAGMFDESRITRYIRDLAEVFARFGIFGDREEVLVPTAERLNVFMEKNKSPVRFRDMSFLQFQRYTAKDFTDNMAQGYVLLASRGRLLIHDRLEHLPGILFMPQEVFAYFVAWAQNLKAKGASQRDMEKLTEAWDRITGELAGISIFEMARIHTGKAPFFDVKDSYNFTNTVAIFDAFHFPENPILMALKFYYQFENVSPEELQKMAARLINDPEFHWDRDRFREIIFP